MDRSNIWREMKQISQKAGVNPDKVFPIISGICLQEGILQSGKGFGKAGRYTEGTAVSILQVLYNGKRGETPQTAEKMNLLIDRYNQNPLLL
ncbi:MAG: hypothetical protein ACLVD8_27380 [Enterocloster sp.]|uniref:hypothetical protein n=1 Tax=Enterocloster sp. TaxID=2719315 RepID=UPI0039999002